MPYCPSCGNAVQPDSKLCPNCGSKILEISSSAAVAVNPEMQTTTVGTITSTAKSSNEKIPARIGRAVRPVVEQENKLLRRFPRIDPLDFWLIVGGLLLLYSGISEIVLVYGPGLVFAIGAILIGAVYIYLARTHYLGEGTDWILQACVGLPVLVVIGDFIVTGVFTSLSALLVIVNLLVIFDAFRTLQQSTLTS